jgi:hypothetical protein
MTLFDRLSFQQRAYALQKLVTLVDMLKESMLREQLEAEGQLLDFGDLRCAEVEAKLLAFSLNHFGQPYSYEASEGVDLP